LILYPPNAAHGLLEWPSVQSSRLAHIVQVLSSPHTSVRLHRRSASLVFEVVVLADYSGLRKVSIAGGVNKWGQRTKG
jgi:hypothetical protein